MLFFDSIERATEIASFDFMFLILYNIVTAAGADPLSIHTARVTPSPSSSTPTSVGGPDPTPPSCPASGALLLPGRWSRESMSREICRLVDYCLQGKHGSLGAFRLLSPLRAAYNNLSHDVRITHWLERIFRDIADSKGFKIGNHILNQPTLTRPFTT